MHPHIIERRWRLLWLALAGLAIYGSLYPFQGRAAPLPWRTLLAVPEHISRSDILGNIALFVPLGFCGALALRRGRVLLVLISGGALAVALQVAQLWTAQRTAALYDAGWNVVGLLAGLLAARVFGRLAAGRHASALGSTRAVAALLMVAWLGSELLPWVPSLDWQHIKDNARPLLTGTASLSGWQVFDTGLRTVAACEVLAVGFGAAGSLALLPLGGLLLLGKALVVGQTLTPSVVLGVALGAGLTLLGLALRTGLRRLLVILLLPAGMAALALLPFDPYLPRLAADWVPFAGLLRGDMLLNAQALAGRLFLYTAFLWLLREEGARPMPAALGLALWLALLELLQVVLPGQRADMTEPLWALLCGWGLALLPTTAAGPVDAASGAPARPTTPVSTPPPPVANPPAAPWRPRPWATTLRAGLQAAGLTLALLAVLRVPALPYNVRELFLLDGAAPAVFVFSLAALWIGGSAAWIGQALAQGRSPWLFFPGAVLLAALINLGLLYCSVTTESILDIAGSNNLFWFVTQRDLWGPLARELFLRVGPEPVALVERPVRYAALVGPIWFFLAFAVAVSRGLRGRRVLAAALSALPWLWLCKAIAFDGSSTDNLNELIARHGLWGTGGGGYLYALLMLICVSAALLAHRWRPPLLAPAAWVLVLLGVPLGWWLLTHGLEPAVHKYERVFSGWQFLLAPDRDHTLADSVLLWRWAAVQLGLVCTFAAGAWAAAPVLRGPPGVAAQRPVAAGSRLSMAAAGGG